MNRLFEMVYLLIEKQTITARELAEHFEVSQRTIYRDIETLSVAGVPVYTSKGKGGGISILPDYILQKSLLSDAEQKEILSALKSLHALQVPHVEPTLNKLASLFKKNNANWIDVDLSHWKSAESDREAFKLLKNAILQKNVLEFEYYNSVGNKSCRQVEPLKIVFKGQAWYLYGYCREKESHRMFKISRIKKLETIEESFDREPSDNIWKEVNDSYEQKIITLVLKVEAKMAYRLFDEFPLEDIEHHPDGSFIVRSNVPENEWIYGYIMSYGEHVEIVEPKQMREAITDLYTKALKKYR
ncbi:helix-turn-helix transcriptional regulator [Caldalkalibacillus mannanilyticus]|uniref:helix-turn-helix transcriptional regulator n=1 Tax=Caldalkalibacillus mannanilyticus TaxID=1418 RepID=UPI001901B798|nr:YafY family protein [Caldalkalibacillus mannanilyticus]